MRHHQEAHRLHPELLGDLEMFLGDISLGTLRGDAHYLSAVLSCLLEFFHG